MKLPRNQWGAAVQQLSRYLTPPLPSASMSPVLSLVSSERFTSSPEIYFAAIQWVSMYVQPGSSLRCEFKTRHTLGGGGHMSSSGVGGIGEREGHIQDPIPQIHFDPQIVPRAETVHVLGTWL